MNTTELNEKELEKVSGGKDSRTLLTIVYSYNKDLRDRKYDYEYDVVDNQTRDYYVQYAKNWCIKISVYYVNIKTRNINIIG